MNKQAKSKSYIFTSKKQSEKGIMSTVLGTISLTSFAIVVFMALRNRGDASLRMGAVGLVALIMSVVSFILAIMGLREDDIFPLFPRLGLAFAILSIAAWGTIIYIGVMGI